MGNAAEDLKITLKETHDKERLRMVFFANTRKKILFISALAISLLALSVISLSIGSVHISIADTLKSILHAILPNVFEGPSRSYYADIIINGRMPRVFLVLLTGTALAAAGTIMQGLLRNPMVSPFTLGVSTAASFGAAMAIVFGSSIFGPIFYTKVSSGAITFYFSDLIIIITSFLFGLCSIIVVLALTRKEYTSRSTVILAGVVISYLFQAGISFSKYISNEDALREITLWIMGGMWNATWGAVLILIPVVIACILYLEYLTLDINAMSSGDDVANNLGINVKKMRVNGLIVSTLVTSACIAFTGVIGFIGLMAPHMCRMIIGNDYRYILPASALMGSLILLISDTVARVIIRPSELPVGIIMYVIGGIFFLWMISRKNWGKML